MMARTSAPSVWGVLLLVASLGWTPSAHALFGDDDARKAIIELRNRFDAHKQAADAAQARQEQALQEALSTVQRNLLELTNDNQKLRGELAQLRGQNEELARQLSEVQRQQKDVQAGVDARLRQVEPTSVTVDGLSFAAAPDEQRAFESAMAQLRAAQFGPAAASFDGFLRRYPASGYVPSALYWLGNAHYASRDYKSAVDVHRRLAQEFPAHMRTPEALLAVANSQIEMKDLRSARTTLEALLKSHPAAEAAAAARERLARLR